MTAWNILIHFTSLKLVLLADAATISVHANWMENLVIGLVLIFSSAFVLQGTWNGLLVEFPGIGRLSYFRAMHIIALLGVLLSALWYFFF